MLAAVSSQTQEFAMRKAFVRNLLLAAMAGVATETVSRTLTDFKDENLIDKKGSQITVLSPERLAKMKN